MQKKKKKIATRIIAMLLMLGVLMTSTGFDSVTAMVEKDSSGNSLNSNDTAFAEEKPDESSESADSEKITNSPEENGDVSVQEDKNTETGTEDSNLMVSEEVNGSALSVPSSNDAVAEENEIQTTNDFPAVRSDYPQSLELYGEYIKLVDESLRVRLLIERTETGTFKMKMDYLSTYALHTGLPQNVYEIYVIPKEEVPDGKIQNLHSLDKETLVSMDTWKYMSKIDFSKLLNYEFEVGDMLCFSPYIDHYPMASFTGERMVPDGNRTSAQHDGAIRVAYDQYWNGARETLFEITDSGIREIVNLQPSLTSSDNFKSLYVQKGGKGINEDTLIRRGIKASDDRDADGRLSKNYSTSNERPEDYTNKVTYTFPSGGNGVDESGFNLDTPSSWGIQYSVQDAWGTSTSKTRNIFVFPDFESVNVDLNALAYQSDASININLAAGESIEENVEEHFVKFGDIANNYVTKINTRSYNSQDGSLFDVIYGSDNKKFYVSSQGDAYLPDGGVISAEKIKQVEVAQDRSVTIDTSYTNHEGKEVSVKVTSTGEVIYPLELYIDSLSFEDEKLGKIEIADFYYQDPKYYLQVGQICELKLAFWNPVPVEIDETTKTFKVQNFSLDDKWMDVLSAKGAGDAGTNEIEYHVPEKGNGKEILQEQWQFKVLPNSEKYIVTCEVALPEDFSIDVVDYISLPYMLFEAYMTEADGSEIEGVRVGRSIAVVSDPVIENKNILWPIENGNSLGSDYARKNMASARTYDDKQWHSLADVSTNNLKITNEEYKRYDFTSSAWTDSSKENFEGLTDVQDGNPTIYSYGFTVKDTRRETLGYDATHPLESTGTSLMFAASKVAANTDKTKALMANGTVPVFTETKVATYGSDEDVVNEILRQVSFEAVQVSGDGTVTDLNVGTDVLTTIEGEQSFSRSNPKPGEYTLFVYFSGQEKTSGIEIAFKIEENTWSYDTSDRTEQDGASGFIVIPKSITMERDPEDAPTIITADKPVIAGKGEVYFANYPNATEVKYDVSIDDTITLSKEGDTSNSFEAQSYVEGSSLVEGEGKRLIGELNNSKGQENGVELYYYSTDQKAFTSKGKWTGIATFYFSRK